MHFSVSHMAATTQVGDDNDFFMGVPLRPTVLPESPWHEVYAAAIRATEEVFDYARGWASRKGPASWRDPRTGLVTSAQVNNAALRTDPTTVAARTDRPARCARPRPASYRR